MKNPFDARAPSFDADAINATIQRALASAGIDTSSGPMHAVTQTIRRALAPITQADMDQEDQAKQPFQQPVQHPTKQAHVQQPGSFTAHTFSNRAGSRSYKVYVPQGHADMPRATVVMLHGCTQSVDDFAVGTQMNRLADQHGFLVVYPEQSAQANPSKCWNWFKPEDQARGAGEPSLIAGIVREVVDSHSADPSRIFVAGLSAGAAMAVVLGEAYPELFAGVGAHSGLPYGSAHDVASAMGVMKGGRSGMAGAMSGPLSTGAVEKKAVHAVPVIVFHGDRDHTVQQSNGAHIVQQALAAHSAQGGRSDLVKRTEEGQAPGGKKFSRTLHTGTDGVVRIEDWVLHGAGHAWSGGNASGTYTDSTGPDASAEMVRFFLSLHTVAGDLKNASNAAMNSEGNSK